MSLRLRKKGQLTFSLNQQQLVTSGNKIAFPNRLSAT